MSTIELWLDLESRSKVDLKKSGLSRYAADPSTQILMVAWAVSEALPVIWRPHERPIPEELDVLMRRPEVVKFSFNAAFERTMFRDVQNIDIPENQFTDPQALCRYASVAGSLDFCGKVLGIDEDKAKMAVGKKLIRRFSYPKKDGTFWDWNTDPEGFAEFERYCLMDVVAEREIYRKLQRWAQLPPTERRTYLLDARINQRGIPVDGQFVAAATKIVEEERQNLVAEMQDLSGLANPNSPKQLLEWLKTQAYPYGSLGAEWVAKCLGNGIGFENSGISSAGRRVLELRQQLSKSSTAKLKTLTDTTSPDGRLRNQYKYYGAARTGRWSAGAGGSSSVQLQNLPRGTVKEFEAAVEAVRHYETSADMDKIRRFGSPLEVVSSCLRGAFRAPAGKQFVACDLNAIETRVLGWLSDCKGINDIFTNTEGRNDPYISYGVSYYGKPYESITKQERQDAKPAMLQCGYQAGGGEIKTDKNGDEYKSGLWGYAEKHGVIMAKEQAHEAVRIYREIYPEVVALWKKCERASIAAIRTGEPQRVGQVVFGAVKPCKLLWIMLPSGRRLHYIRPRLETSEGWDGAERVQVSYEGNLIGKTWGRKHSYGGHWVENLCQAISRDILVEGMLNADAAGFEIVGSSHDEIISLVDVNSKLDLAALRDCMIRRPTWLGAMPLEADGFTSVIYKKN